MTFSPSALRASVQLVAVQRTKNQDVDVADSTVVVPPPRRRAAQGLAPYAGIAAQEAGRLGTEFVHERHSIVDMDVPRSPQQTAGILDAIDKALEDGKNVYVHCWGGIGRTGTVVGCWLVRHGMTGDEALAEIAERWRGMEKRYRHPRSPQTQQQRRYVRSWTEPSPGAAA